MPIDKIAPTFEGAYGIDKGDWIEQNLKSKGERAMKTSEKFKEIISNLVDLETFFYKGFFKVISNEDADKKHNAISGLLEECPEILAALEIAEKISFGGDDAFFNTILNGHNHLVQSMNETEKVTAERDSLRELAGELAKILQKHHAWQNEIGAIKFIGANENPPIEDYEIDLSAEYVDSTMSGETIGALAKATAAGLL